MLSLRRPFLRAPTRTPTVKAQTFTIPGAPVTFTQASETLLDAQNGVPGYAEDRPPGHREGVHVVLNRVVGDAPLDAAALLHAEDRVPVMGALVENVVDVNEIARGGAGERARV